MANIPAHGGADSGGSARGDSGTGLDPANQSLADALRKSFRVLKLLMLVLVGLYFLSGWFSVKPSEVGVVLRFGRIRGAGPGQQAVSAVLQSGWHWSWPYPIERWETVSTSERELPVEFLFELSEEEQIGGIKGYKYNTLSPARDDYLITGDVNILHAAVVVKYKITDAVAYLSNVLPAPDPQATARSLSYKRYPEYTILTNLVRCALIETAAGQEVLRIRGNQQDQFLLAVARRSNEKLKALEKAGVPLGIEVDPNNGILATKKSGIEAIMPPRQVQEVFDRTFAAQTEKSVTITKASSEAQSTLLKTAGVHYEEAAAAVQKEFDLLTAVGAADSRRAEAKAGLAAGAGGGARVESTPPRPGVPETSTEAAVGGDIETLRAELRKQRLQTEALLEQCSGDVQTVLNNARIARDVIIKEASGDYARFQEVLPEYLNNPGIFMSRFLDDMYAKALNNRDVVKVFVPPEAKEYRLYIPRTGKPSEEGAKEDQAHNAEAVLDTSKPRPRKE